MSQDRDMDMDVARELILQASDYFAKIQRADFLGMTDSEIDELFKLKTIFFTSLSRAMREKSVLTHPTTPQP